MPRRRSGGAMRPTRPLLQTRVRRFEGVFDAVGTPAFPEGEAVLRAPHRWESMARWCSRRRQEHGEKRAIGTIACQAVIRESVPNAIAFGRAGCTVIYRLSCIKYSGVVQPRVILFLCVGVACDGNAPAQQYICQTENV